MSEQRFTIQKASRMYLHLPIFDNGVEMADGDVCILLNEQQDTINKQLDQIIELQDKYRILEFNHSRLEKRNKAQYEKIGEQQAEIERLKEQLSLVCKAESSAPYNSVKEVLRRQIFGLDCAAEESANAWNHYCVLNKLFQEQYGEYWDNED